ncbi:MAG: acyl-CoA thioesterase [Nannocystis sp.]|nr:acyl-CoA thioesterase [Nannocystis sp.]
MTRRLYEVTVDFEVPFHDVDSLNIVWHGHYYKYMELGRTALLRSRGVDVAMSEQIGYQLLLIESRCRYTFSMRYGDRGRVHAWFSALRPRLSVAYRIRNLTHDRCSARGLTELVTIDRDGQMLPETPDDLLALLHR